MSDKKLSLENFPLPLNIRFASKVITSRQLNGKDQELCLPRLASFAGKTGELRLGDFLLARVVVKLKEESSSEKVWLVMKKSGVMLNQQALKNLVAQIKVPLSCELGHTALSLEEMARLKPGVELPLAGKIGSALLSVDCFRLYAGWGEVVTVGKHFGLKLKEFELQKALQEPALNRNSPTGRPRVELKAILGRAVITLAELLRLQPGTVLPLETHIAQPVALHFSNGLQLQGRIMVKQDRFHVRLLDPEPLGLGAVTLPRVESGGESRSPVELTETLKRADPALISLTLQRELPQTIAFILFRMDEYKASRVMKYLPLALQVEVTAKIVALAQKAINYEFVDLLSRHFEHIADSESPGKDVENQGINFAATMLNYSDKKMEESVIQGLEKEYPELAESIKFRMFIFDDIRLLDNRAIQRILKELDTRDLAVALKSVSRELIRKVYQNMPERDGKLLKQEIEYIGPVLRSDVEKAQAKIIDFIRILEENGEIVIDRSGDEVI